MELLSDSVQTLALEEDDRVSALEGSVHKTLGVVRSDREANLQARDMGAEAGPILGVLRTVLGTN